MRHFYKRKKLPKLENQPQALALKLTKLISKFGLFLDLLDNESMPPREKQVEIAQTI